MPQPKGLLVLCLLFTMAAFVLGINWGLPSRGTDRFLFGDRTPWTGAEIMQQLGPRAGGAIGADVDRNPVQPSAEPIALNQTDAQRAEIVRRYRLYSAQPDEMITFMALAEMKPRQMRLDPKLYQYGGLWIYPVGGMLAAGAVVQFIELRTDLSFYLDRPDAFARFYLIARGYSAVFGLIGAWAVWWIVLRLTRVPLAAAAAVIGYALLPVVNNMAHEAKPHLPGAVLMLLAVMAATKYIETGGKKWWMLAALDCGAAPAMILSAAPVVLILPIMLLLRPAAWRARFVILAAAAIIAIDAYLLSNPYVLKHLINWNAAQNPLRSNLANSRAMYAPALTGQSFLDAARLLGYAVTLPVLIAGVLGAVALMFGADRTRPPENEPSWRARGSEPLSFLLAAPAAVILIQFVLLASGKPAEYARFALFPSIVLLIFAFSAIWRMIRPSVTAAVVLVGLTLYIGVHGVPYVWHFLLDSGPRPTRTIVAERMQMLNQRGAESLAVYAEPAPYAVPPVDLWRWRIELRRPRQTGDSDVSILAVDHQPPLRKTASSPPAQAQPAASQPARVSRNWIRARLLPTPISWAAKPFVVAGRAVFFDSADARQ